MADTTNIDLPTIGFLKVSHLQHTLQTLMHKRVLHILSIKIRINQSDKLIDLS